MGNREQTRTVLLEAGRAAFLEKGYHGTGIEEVLRASGVPKGSFYYYFASKEDFGLRVIDHFVSEQAEALDRELNDPSLSPLQRLNRHIESAIERFEDGQCRGGCLIGKLSQEMVEQSEAFRDRLIRAFNGWADRIAACLEEAQRAGEIRDDLDVRALAEFWIDGWQGALERAKTLRSSTPLRNFLKQVLGAIGPPTKGPPPV